MGGLAVDLEGKVALVSEAPRDGHRYLHRARSIGCVGRRRRPPCRANGCGRRVHPIDWGSAAPAIGDVADSTQVEHLVATALAEFGGLDIVVNAAGVIHRADAEGTTDADWHRVMSINVDGTFFLSRAAVPVMRQRGGGVIVNISSTCGLVGSSALVAYCVEGGGHEPHPGDGARSRLGEHSYQRDLPWFGRHAHACL